MYLVLNAFIILANISIRRTQLKNANFVWKESCYAFNQIRQQTKLNQSNFRTILNAIPSSLLNQLPRPIDAVHTKIQSNMPNRVGMRRGHGITRYGSVMGELRSRG